MYKNRVLDLWTADRSPNRPPDMEHSRQPLPLTFYVSHMPERLSRASCPAPSQNNIGYFIYDDLQDGESVMDQPIASLDGLPFVNGIDYFISPEPHRTIPVKLVDRDSGAEHLVNVPSLKCLSEGVVVVQFNDFD